MSQQRGTITKRNNAWCYRFSYLDSNGNRRWKSAQGFKTKADAQRFMISHIAEIDSGKGINPAKISLADYLTAWLDEYRRANSGRKATTIAETRTNINAYILPMLCNQSDRPLMLAKLKPETVARFAADLLDHGRRGVNGNAGGALSPKSVRNIVATLRNALETARRRGHIPSNPADHIELPKWVRRDLQVWESAQFAHFLTVAAAADDYCYALWRLVIATGMRRGELLGLRWADVELVDLERGATVTIRQARVSDGYTVTTTTPKTKAGRRTIAIDSGTVIALAFLKNQQAAAAESLGLPNFEFVATDLDGRLIKPATLLDRFHAATQRANLPKCRLHDLRHSAAAYQLEIGTPVHIVAGRLGHASPATTLNIYAAFLPTADRGASNEIGATLDRLMANDQTRTLQAIGENQNGGTANAAKDLIQSKARTKRAPNFKKHSDLGTTSAHHANIEPNQNNENTSGGNAEIVPPLGFEPKSARRKPNKDK
jgi:integrase